MRYHASSSATRGRRYKESLGEGLPQPPTGQSGRVAEKQHRIWVKLLTRVRSIDPQQVNMVFGIL